MNLSALGDISQLNASNQIVNFPTTSTKKKSSKGRQTGVSN